MQQMFANGSFISLQVSLFYGLKFFMQQMFAHLIVSPVASFSLCACVCVRVCVCVCVRARVYMHSKTAFQMCEACYFDGPHFSYLHPTKGRNRSGDSYTMCVRHGRYISPPPYTRIAAVSPGDIYIATIHIDLGMWVVTNPVSSCSLASMLCDTHTHTHVKKRNLQREKRSNGRTFVTWKILTQTKRKTCNKRNDPLGEHLLHENF